MDTRALTTQELQNALQRAVDRIDRLEAFLELQSGVNPRIQINHARLVSPGSGSSPITEILDVVNPAAGSQQDKVGVCSRLCGVYCQTFLRRAKVTTLVGGLQNFIQYMDAMSDRFARAEQEEGELRSQLLHLQGIVENKLWPLQLLREDMMRFSDGYRWEWTPMASPLWPRSVNDPLMIPIDSSEAIPMDEDHWHAQVWPMAVNLEYHNRGHPEIIPCKVQGSLLGGGVVLRDLVEAMKEAWHTRLLASGMGAFQDMASKKLLISSSYKSQLHSTSLTSRNLQNYSQWIATDPRISISFSDQGL